MKSPALFIGAGLAASSVINSSEAFVPTASTRSSCVSRGTPYAPSDSVTRTNSSTSLHAKSGGGGGGGIQRPENEFSRKYRADTVLPGGRTARDYKVSIEANEEERAALAERFRLSEIARLEANVVLRRDKSGSAYDTDDIHMDGTVLATVTQKCVRTNEDFDVNLEFDVNAAVRPVQSTETNDDADMEEIERALASSGGGGGGGGGKRRNKRGGGGKRDKTFFTCHDTMERSIEVQEQIRRDAEDHCRALRELKEWEEEMKRRKEEEQEQLQRQKDTTTNCSGAEDDTTANVHVEAQTENQPSGLTTQPVPSSNVDTDGCNGGVGGVRANINSTAMAASTKSNPTSISNHERDANQSPEEMTANAERQRGNDCYAAGKYDDAIKCYTACLRFDPRSAVVYSNRAMAHLKRKDWLKAEDDASMALTIDASHVKSYQRRSVARASFGKLRAALLDLSRAEVELESLGATGGDISGMQKSIAAERKRVESMLRAAMKRAPKRCNVPIVVVHDDKEEYKEELVEELSDGAVSKAGSVDDGSASGVSKESDDWVVVDTSVSGRNNESPTQPSNTSSPAKLVPRQHKKPTTWYEFETTWRRLDSLEERSAYLSSIRPKRLANLYRNGMEDIEIVVDVVVAAGRLMTMDANQAASLAKEYIQCVANIKSIDIPVMMMNDGQRKKVQDVIDKVFGGDNGKAAVAFKFGCSL